MLRLILKTLLPLFLFSICQVTMAAQPTTTSCQGNTLFNVGAGIYDITGPAAEQRMMGYAMIYQQTEGILQRLWARAFIIESPCNAKRVVFVNADLGQVFQAVKMEVVRKLQLKYGDRYTADNVLITATHQHSGPGGYSTYTLYNLTTLGFSRDNFNTIVDGIVAAIDRAQNNIQPAHIKIAKGQLRGVNYNRSPDSYLHNPQAERALYPNDTDTEMTLVRFDTINGKPIGIINWFPVHGVSMSNKNRLINGDNKGYAEYLFEKDFHSDYGPSSFVAAFAQANAGDVSPNPYGHEGAAGLAGLEALDKAGRPQYTEAKALFNDAHELLTGGIDYRHTYEQMDKITIDPKLSNGLPHTTCTAAIGVSMLAGTQDGEGVGMQGLNCNTISSVVPGFVCAGMTTACQGAKPIAIQTGDKFPFPWTPNVLPLQLFKVGTLTIAAAPFELTTMTGRRIRQAIANELPATHHVVLSALANAYAQYMATPEEYELQRYEGASTLFGPWASVALQQEFIKLTQAMEKGEPVAPGPIPIDLVNFQFSLQTGVVFDDKPLGKQFGDVAQNVKPLYQAGDTVQVQFWGAHPKNNYRIQDTFLEVQQLVKGEWQTIRTDRDIDTEYHWQRSGIANSLVTISWHIPTEIPPGQYRIVHHGDAKSLWTGKISPYTGSSAIFTIN